jgi:diacylglycerol kinase family enzyme
VRAEISVDGGPYQRFRARTVVIGNVGNLQAGIPLFPEAVIDDGRLDVVVIAPRSSLGWLRLLWRVLLRRPRTDDRLARMTGREVVVRVATPAPRQLDGDLVSDGRELRANVEAGVLLVRVPRRER